MMSTDRRDFLQRLALGSAALGVTPSILPAMEYSSDFDASLRSELLALDSMQQQAIVWDTSWTQKVTGKHRAVFDSPTLEGGSGVYRAAMWSGHYKQVLKVSDADLSTVLVLRHDAIPLVMTHAFWEEHDLAKKTKTMHPMTGKKMKRNPVLLDVETDGLPPSFARFSLDKQIAAGTIVLACNLAFSEMVGLAASKYKLKGEEARRKALESLLPGVILQPSGIFAVQMAQEAGCNYHRAS
jgi:hypothetical protein